MATKAMRLAKDVADILRDAEKLPDRLSLRCGKLSKTLYSSVDRVIEALGGKWNTAAQVHLFSSPYIERLEDVLAGRADLPIQNPDAFFPTPSELASVAIANSKALAALPIGASMLEPEAGFGALAAAVRAVRPDIQIDVCEIDPRNRSELADQGLNLVGDDFLLTLPSKLYDLIVMNPPFSTPADKFAWATHVEHALQFLAPHGVLVAILPEAITYRSGNRFESLRQRFKQDGAILNNPPKAFQSSGTGVKTVTAYIGEVFAKSAVDVVAAAEASQAKRDEEAEWASLLGRISAVRPSEPHADVIAAQDGWRKECGRVGTMFPQAEFASDLFSALQKYTAAKSDMHYCTAHSDPFNTSFRVQCRPEVWAEIKESRAIDDDGYFLLIAFEDGYTRVYWHYNRIIGDRLVGVVTTESIGRMGGGVALSLARAA